MPYCPACKRKFAERVEECPDDHVALVDELPFQVIPGDTTTWVEIASVGTEEEASLLQGFLQAEGIPAQVENLSFRMEPTNFGMLGDVRIYVAAEDEAKRTTVPQRSTKRRRLKSRKNDRTPACRLRGTAARTRAT
jgi:hypothetical protein